MSTENGALVQGGCAERKRRAARSKTPDHSEVAPRLTGHRVCFQE
jgi:hypothetical protein